MALDAVKKKRVEPKVEPYGFDVAFARLVAFYSASSLRFWSLVGAELDAAAFTDPPARLVIETVKAHALETGRGPGSVTLLSQRIRRQVAEGALEYEASQKAYDALEDTEDYYNRPDMENVLAVLLPVLRDRLRQQVAYQAGEDYAKGRQSFDETLALIQRAKTVGLAENDLGHSITGTSIGQILKSVSVLDYLSTGNDELDMLIGGGLRRGCLGAFVGGPGAGKSMSIYHMVAQCVGIGGFGVIATLELGCADVVARCVANLTGITTHTVVASPDAAAEVYAKLPNVGPLYIKDFPPRVTSFDEIKVWVDRCQQRVGRKIDVLGTDYGDKLTVPKGVRVKDQYEGQGIVWDSMRQYAHDEAIFHISASQAKTRDKGSKRALLTDDDLADSKNKSRSLDGIYGVNTSEDYQTIIWNIIKNRHGGGAGKQTVPLPTDFERGRVVVMNEFRDLPGSSGGGDDW